MGGYKYSSSRCSSKTSKKIVRIIFKQPFRAHTNELFLNAKILKLFDVHLYFLCQFVFKNGNLFSSNINLNYETRNSDNLRPQFQRLGLTQKSIMYAAPKAWNSIPSDIRNLENFETFKKELKLFFISKYIDLS